jgi:hypothetical protein
MERLHLKGFISDPESKAKSVVLSEEGEKRSRELFAKHFALKRDRPNNLGVQSHDPRKAGENLGGSRSVTQGETEEQATTQEQRRFTTP